MLQRAAQQVVHSPARLGLSNPTSPSIQSPNPSTKLSSHVPQPQPSHQQQPNISSTKTTSSTLLSLLPPLPRAQALLAQMASLSSKLFEVSPNRAAWLSSFRGSLPTFLSTQSNSMIAPPLESTPSTSKEVITLFTSLQTQLFEAVAELQEILDLQDARQKLNREIKSKDSTILAFANKLKEAEQVLDMLVDDYADYVRPKRCKLEKDAEDKASSTTVSYQLDLSNILSYAHKISYTTFAPPEFGAGQAPLRGALPPAPQDEQMRASQLYSFADLDVGIPKTKEDKEKTLEPLTEAAPLPPPGSNRDGFLPPNIKIPPGWKPGMPVELPTDMPLPPPGWKPGDPVPLPPFGSVPVPPPRAEDQQPRQMPVHVMPRAPEPIQVPHVQLDIDDDSSDYSSDEESSDEED